jgi:hypothetical protein
VVEWVFAVVVGIKPNFPRVLAGCSGQATVTKHRDGVVCCHTMGQSGVSCQVTQMLDSACLQMLGDQPTLGVLWFILVDWGGDQQLRCWPTSIVTHPLQSVSHREMLVSNSLSARVCCLVMSWSPLGMKFCLSHGREATMTSCHCRCLAVDL